MAGGELHEVGAEHTPRARASRRWGRGRRCREDQRRGEGETGMYCCSCGRRSYSPEAAQTASWVRPVTRNAVRCCTSATSRKYPATASSNARAGRPRGRAPAVRSRAAPRAPHDVGAFARSRGGGRNSRRYCTVSVRARRSARRPRARVLQEKSTASNPPHEYPGMSSARGAMGLRSLH